MPPHLLQPVGEPHLLYLGELVADHLDLLGRIEEGEDGRDDAGDKAQPATTPRGQG